MKVLEYKPFDPVSKKTEALVEVHGHQFKVSKGAPQILIRQSNASSEIKKRAMDDVMALAKSGYRSLAVTYTETRQGFFFH